MDNPRKSELWIPPLHEKQRLAFESIATEVLYGGATRGGKSHLVRVAYIVWCSRVPGLQTDIFRLHFDDVTAENMDGPNSFPDLLGPWERDGLVTINKTEIRFWNGSLISLEHCGNDKVMQKHQGVGKHVRTFSEATQIGVPRMKFLRAWVTMTEDMKNTLPDCLADLYPNLTREQLREFFPKILYTTNPIGPSAGYFRRAFVKAAPKYSVWRAPDNDGGFLRQYIPAKVEDNPSEDAAAVKRRVSGIGDDAISDALLNENWDAPVGDFFRQYDDEKHTTPNFRPPDAWFKFITHDWGSSEPFSFLWWCVSDGQEFTDNKGHRRWFPRGALIAYREWHGCSPDDSAKGLELGNTAIARGALERTTESWSGLTLTDSLPFQERGNEKDGKKYKMCDTYRDCGLPLTRANTARVFGCEQVRTRLMGVDGVPMIYFCECCKYAREYLPAIQRDETNPECCADKGEASHSVDIIRYACTTKPIIINAPGDTKEDVQPGILTPSAIIAKIEANNNRRYARR